jgi:hypothetical protein
VITCNKKYLEERCLQRGYSIEEIKDCIVSQDGDNLTIDENHPSYPKMPKSGFIPPQQNIKIPQTSPKTGPGTELKKLLSKIGIKASPNCSCNKRAALMDTNGIEWCENNIDTIVGWLKEEATKRKLPFIDIAGRILVKRAISNAKKNAQ